MENTTTSKFKHYIRLRNVMHRLHSKLLSLSREEIEVLASIERKVEEITNIFKKLHNEKE